MLVGKPKEHMKLPIRRRGFTLVEIMIIIALILLIASIAVPNLLRARKRSQAGRIIQDLRNLDAAMDQYAVEYNKAPGQPADFVDLKKYLKTDTLLYSGTGGDLYGNFYGPFTVDSVPKVNPATFVLLSDVADNSFWSPYQ
jgi:prepilin-type N-terminal cleavage/methylation domain-containing protein